MKKIDPKLILNSFVTALANAIGSPNSLVIHISDFDALNLDTPQTKVNGFQWLDMVPAETQYDLIVANLPFGMEKEKLQIGCEG